MNDLKATTYPNGKFASQTMCNDDKTDGFRVQWYESGQMKSAGEYKYNKPDGLYTVWFENSNKRAEINYKHGKRDGKFTFWYDNGQTKFQGCYSSERAIGIWTLWYSNGQKYKETDTIQGVRSYWYDNGQKKSRQYRIWYDNNTPPVFYETERNWNREGRLIDGDIVTIKKQLNYHNEDNIERHAYDCTYAFTYFNKEGLKEYELTYDWIMDDDWNFDENENRYQFVDYFVTTYNFFDKKGNKNRFVEFFEKYTNEHTVPESYSWKFFNDKDELIYEYFIDQRIYIVIDLYDELLKIDNKELNKTLIRIKKHKSLFWMQPKREGVSVIFKATTIPIFIF